MAVNTSMTVALVLTAVNNMPSVLNTAGRNVQTFASQVAKAGEEISRYNQKIESLERSIKNFNNLKSSGLQDIQQGMLMMAPVEEALRHAANFEGVMKKVEIALYDSTLPAAVLHEQMEALTEQAIELGNQTIFSNTEAAQAQLALIRNGMTVKDVLEGGATAAMYLAQTAEIAPSAAADAVSQITNMFQLQGNQLLQVADDVNRAANASSAGVMDIMHDLQQVGMTAHLLGLDVKETTLLLGTLHNLGLGSSSGNYLNDMLVNLDKMTPKARKALEAMGWLEGATVQTLASGNIRVTGGANSLFDEQGQIRSAEHLVQKLREVLYTNSGLKPEDLRDKSGNLLPQEEIERIMEAKSKVEAMQQLKDVFGIQGMRAAIALATPGKGSYEEMVAQAERAQRIQEQVLGWQETLLGKLETLKGSWETIMTQSGTPLTNEVGKSIETITRIINTLGDLANKYPQITTWILRIVGGMALLKITGGGLKWLFGGLGGFISGVGKVLLTATRSMHGFYDAFKYFRSGAGVFRSLWQAVAFGHPTLTRVLGMVSRFGGGLLRLGGQALIMGAKLALGWLIGLGPVGWIILGVTALIAAGVAAWKTNFGGFRDFVTDLLTRLGSFAIGVFEGIVEKAEGILGAINKVRSYLGMSPLEVELLEKARETIANVKAATDKPKVVSMPANNNDNRQYNINIQSTDPVAAANEVAAKLGGMDKYTASRDPRLQPAFVAGYGGR